MNGAGPHNNQGAVVLTVQYSADLFTVTGNSPNQLLIGRKLLAQLGGGRQPGFLAVLAGAGGLRVQCFRFQRHVHVCVPVSLCQNQKSPGWATSRGFSESGGSLGCLPGCLPRCIRSMKILRSEERRVGKECRSGWGSWY